MRRYCLLILSSVTALSVAFPSLASAQTTGQLTVEVDENHFGWVILKDFSARAGTGEAITSVSFVGPMASIGGQAPQNRMEVVRDVARVGTPLASQERDRLAGCFLDVGEGGGEDPEDVVCPEINPEITDALEEVEDDWVRVVLCGQGSELSRGRYVACSQNPDDGGQAIFVHPGRAGELRYSLVIEKRVMETGRQETIVVPAGGVSLPVPVVTIETHRFLPDTPLVEITVKSVNTDPGRRDALRVEGAGCTFSSSNGALMRNGSGLTERQDTFQIRIDQKEKECRFTAQGIGTASKRFEIQLSDPRPTLTGGECLFPNCRPVEAGRVGVTYGVTRTAVLSELVPHENTRCVPDFEYTPSGGGSMGRWRINPCARRITTFDLRIPLLTGSVPWVKAIRVKSQSLGQAFAGSRGSTQLTIENPVTRSQTTGTVMVSRSHTLCHYKSEVTDFGEGGRVFESGVVYVCNDFESRFTVTAVQGTYAYDECYDACDWWIFEGGCGWHCQDYRMEVSATVACTGCVTWTADCDGASGTFDAYPSIDAYGQQTAHWFLVRTFAWRRRWNSSKPSFTCRFRAMNWKGEWIDPEPRREHTFRIGSTLCDGQDYYSGGSCVRQDGGQATPVSSRGY